MQKYYPKKKKDSKGSKAETLIQHRLVAKRYMIKMVIREDEMSVDHLAYDREMDRNVALKVIPPEVAKDQTALSALKRETDAAMLLADEHITRLYNLETWKDLTFAVYEYVPGSSLYHMMEENERLLNLEEALALLKQVAEAIDFAHQNRPRIIHADLKPSNILLTESGVVKVADFGVARVFSDTIIRVSAAEDAATFGYKAPEQIAGREVNAATDIYALAAIAYEMLSGRSPFYEGDLRYQILHSQPGKIDDVPEHVNQAIFCGLSKNQADRPKTAGDFIAMLSGEKPVPMVKEEPRKPVKDEEPPALPQPDAAGKPVVPEKKSKKSRLPVILGILLLAVAAGAGWWFQMQQGETAKPEAVQAPQQQGPVTPEAAPPVEPAQGIKIERPTIGDIAVDSKPPGAEVYLDDKKLGMTPTTLTDVKEGPHTLMLKKDGFDEWRKEIEIVALKRSEVIAELESLYGGLEVTSTPEEAEVYLDGKKFGQTPVTLQQVKKGERTIVVKKEGYEDWEQKVKIASGESIKLFAELGEVYGSLLIESRPAEADVYLDGRKQGKTPLTLERVKEGGQEIEITREGYLSWKEKVTVKPGATVQIMADLNAAYGSLNISSRPEGATVLINGKNEGKTPLTVSNLKSGRLQVEVGMDCHESIIRDIVIPAGKSAESAFELKSICGGMSVVSEPAGAKWFLNEKPQGNTPGQLKGLEKGKYTVKITKTDHIDWVGIVEVKPDATETVEAKLEPVPPKVGDYYKDPVTGMMFTWVEGGCYSMGSPATESARDTDEGPVHEVCVNGFWMGIFEVTQAEWKQIMGGNPSFFNKGGNYPVENVSWISVQSFIGRLNQRLKDKLGKAARSSDYYRLPTEAEWEFAARERGGSLPYSGGNQVNAVGWNKGNSKRTSHPVGKKVPNNLGIFDMSGNVYEWVEDLYVEDAYAAHARSNPVVKSGGSERVARGGSWYHSEKDARSAKRNKFAAETPNTYVGFRLVRPK
ncbi:MAG: PEGA domain-containing protein [Thermodesulfobacteriota bacterium]